jgi:phthalate 4,5-cis-dihydrodiol dehydrogenase
MLFVTARRHSVERKEGDCIVTNRIAAALPVRDIRQNRNVEPIPIEPRTAGEDSVGALRVGIVGVGAQTANHLLPALLTLPTVRITALVDPARERRDALANRIGVSSGFDSVAQVDAVVAACPPQAHEQIAAAAIAALVPVFVEKPPATTITTLTELAEAAAESGVVTGVGMNFRWAAPVRHISALLDGGAYGHPTVITIRHVASKPRAPMWGLSLLRSFLLAQAIHPVDLLLRLAGEPVIDIHVTRQVGSTGTMVALQLGFASGVVGSLVCGSQATRFESRIEVTTSSGATMSVTSLGELTVTGGLVPLEIGDPRCWSQLWRPSPLDVGFDRTGFGAELAAFSRAAASGADFSPGLADLLPTYDILDRIEGR